MGAKGIRPELNVESFYALETIYLLSKKPFSRRSLMKALCLSESKTRTLLQHLQRVKYIKPSTKGYVLTENGAKSADRLSAIIKDLREIDLGNLIKEKKGFALHAGKIKFPLRTYQVRDIAVKAGAEGALVLKTINNKLEFADSTAGRYENKLAQIEKQLCNLNDNDTVIVSFAPNTENAKSGLWNIIESLINAG